MNTKDFKTARYSGFFILAIVLMVIPLVANFAGEQFYVRLVMRIMVFAIMGVSLNLILGYGGLVSFGHAMFVGIAAYVVAILGDHAFQGTDLSLGWFAIPGSLNALITWPLAILVSAAVAALFGFIVLRTSGLYFIMITLALAQMTYFIAVSLQDYGGADGLQIMGEQYLGPISLDNRTSMYYIVLVALGLSILTCKRVVESGFGLVFRASSQNETRLLAVGAPVFRYRLVAFIISGALAGLAGVLLASSQSFVSPADLSWMRSGELIVMVVVGGMGTLLGPVLGAFFYLLAEYFLSGVTDYWQMFMGPLLIFIVLFARRGLMGLVPLRLQRQARQI